MKSTQELNEKSIVLAGSTGYIGRYVLCELMVRGYQVTSLGRCEAQEATQLYRHIPVDFCDESDLMCLEKELPKNAAVISCLGSKTGGRRDAWVVDYGANQSLLNLSKRIQSKQFVLLSAICVQKPRLEFQFAKRAFEDNLIASGMPYSIVRPTAYFKSLAGQVENVKKGKAFWMFDTGKRTACKPISGKDLATYICDCLDHPQRTNRVLPIGGPGPAINSKEQAEILFKLLGKPVKTRKISSAFFKVLNGCLAPFGIFSEKISDKREFLRIGYYYATESMLAWDDDIDAYNADRTPEFGKDTLETFYEEVLEAGLQNHDLGAHKLF